MACFSPRIIVTGFHAEYVANCCINFVDIVLNYVVCCKVMEHIIFHSIMNHLNTHNIINPNQHGFRPGFSCVTQLMLLTDDILKAMDSHYQVNLVLLDFPKAFDTVAHNKRLHKLTHYGIQSDIHR